ncbi:death-associated protein kinase 1 [Aedes albopictus]|uniref:Uncharacterized protein n=1 Tax=Aedes albopictus TaxID=7160 RepID=A0ABM1Y1U5_AEDAL
MVVPLIEKILSSGADIDQPNNNGNPALFLASNTTTLDVLVRHGCKLDVVNNKGKTALEYRIRNRNMVIALLRLTHKLPLFKAHAHKYFAPLIFGNRVFFTQTYRPFLEANPDTLKTLFDSLYENSPEFASELFNKACCNGQYFVVEKFLTFNYDLNYNVRDQDGSTCIVGWLKNMYGQRDDALVERLLAKGVDLEIRDKTGRNALLTFVGRFSSEACYEHSIKTVQLLLDHGARLDARDAAGNSALHLAFARGELELVEVLLRNGADFTARNCNGEIPIQMGRRMHQELFDFIS